jgi:hypothetical protein
MIRKNGELLLKVPMTNDNEKWKMENEPFLTCELAGIEHSFGDQLVHDRKEVQLIQRILASLRGRTQPTHDPRPPFDGYHCRNRLRGLLYCQRQMVAVPTRTDSRLWRRLDWPFFYREKQARNIPASLMVLYG